MIAANTARPSWRVSFARNRTLIILLGIIALVFLLAVTSMSPRDWVITLLRGLAVGAVTFLVAAGFSLIFGLMDVLNLAQGALFMIGAYVAWTVYVRPDTFVDLLTPLALIVGGLLLKPVWEHSLGRVNATHGIGRVWPWLLILAAIAIFVLVAPGAPIAAWSPENYNQSPVVYSMMLEQGQLQAPPAAAFEGPGPVPVFGGLLLAAALLAAGLAGFALRRKAIAGGQRRLPVWALISAGVLVVAGLAVHLINTPLTLALFSASTNLRFLIALVVATLTGFGLGALMEVTLIRPLYSRPLYQLMLTLGLGVVVRQLVLALWGRTQITMPNPALFAKTGDGCPATGIGDWLGQGCSTITLMGARIRTYNEIFVILMGLFVLIAVWLLLKRTRLGMIIRAGVQDGEMVQALGINVRQVFTLVFALGVALAALGGGLAAPSMGLTDAMGENLLLLALIALAIGGLTSFPGAAAGSVLVGLLQQFVIKYGQIGIALPFLDEPFRPSPPLVPASTVLLMVIVLLAKPNGLFGKKE